MGDPAPGCMMGNGASTLDKTPSFRLLCWTTLPSVFGPPCGRLPQRGSPMSRPLFHRALQRLEPGAHSEPTALRSPPSNVNTAVLLHARCNESTRQPYFCQRSENHSAPRVGTVPPAGNLSGFSRRSGSSEEYCSSIGPHGMYRENTCTRREPHSQVHIVLIRIHRIS